MKTRTLDERMAAFDEAADHLEACMGDVENKDENDALAYVAELIRKYAKRYYSKHAPLKTSKQR